MMTDWFPSWKGFHKTFHKTELVDVDGLKYLFCKDCERYVPPCPMGECVECGATINLKHNMAHCKSCFAKLEAMSQSSKPIFVGKNVRMKMVKDKKKTIIKLPKAKRKK